MMKKRLVDYIKLNEEIDDEIERLDRLDDRMASLGGGQLSGMPKAASPAYDRMSDAVSRRIDLEKKINCLIVNRNAERAALEALVDQLDVVRERTVIRSRYLDLEDWKDVLFVMFGRKDDFNDRYEMYTQKMFRYHRAAIGKLAMLQSRQ